MTKGVRRGLERLLRHAPNFMVLGMWAHEALQENLAALAWLERQLERRRSS